MTEQIKMPKHLAAEWSWVVGKIKQGDRFLLSSGDVSAIPSADIGTETDGPHMGISKKPVGYVRPL